MSSPAPHSLENWSIQRYQRLALAAVACMVLAHGLFSLILPESMYIQASRAVAMLGLLLFYCGARFSERVRRRPEPYFLAADLILVAHICIGLHQTGFALEFSPTAYLMISVVALSFTEQRIVIIFIACSVVAFIGTSAFAVSPKVNPIAFSFLIAIHGVFTGTLVTSMLRARNKQLRTRSVNTAIFETSMDGMIYGYTRTAQVLAANPRARELFETDDKDQIGQLARDGFDRTFGDTARDILQQSLSAQGWRGTLSLRTARDRVFWGDVSFSRMHSAEEDMVMVQVGDATERMEDQTRLRDTKLLLDRSQSMARVGGWQLDTIENKWSFTRSARHILHLPADQDTLYRALLRESGATRRLIVDAFRNTLTTGATFDMEMKVCTWNKQELLVRVLGEAIITGGRVVKVIGVFTDISERQQREAELREARDAAEDAAKARSQFLANMSHEIRTPMNGVIGMASLLMESDLADEHKRLVGTINKSGEALLAIINEILDFSKIDAGEMQLEATPFDPQALLQQTAELFTPLATRKELEFEFVSDSALTPGQRLLGDEGRLRQILNNLLSNAIKFTETGKVTLRCALTERQVGATRQAHLAITVSDSGIGIDPDRIKNLFEPFAQADSSITRRYGGTGLGLSICKQLAELMGGRLQAVSTPGSGSDFTVSVTLPIDQQAHVTATTQVEVDISALRESVLLVEDNKVNQAVATKMLQRLGIEADLAENGRQAIERLQHKHYAVVFMDMQMPEIDGIEATRLIRVMDDLPQPHIIAMTANALEADRQQCLDAGMDGFIAKPIRLDDIRSSLHALDLEQLTSHLASGD
ncbi:MAG: ATP-binding protein [Pseudomonadales bacterium]